MNLNFSLFSGDPPVWSLGSDTFSEGISIDGVLMLVQLAMAGSAAALVYSLRERRAIRTLTPRIGLNHGETRRRPVCRRPARSAAPADARRHGMMDNQQDSGRKNQATLQDDVGDPTAETAEVFRGGAGDVRGNEVTMRQAGARSVSANQLTIRQGGAVRAQAGHLEMRQGGVGLCRAESASLVASQAGAVLTRGDVTMDQANARFLVAGGGVTMDQAGAFVLASREVKADQCGVVFLLAGRVDGTVNAVFDLRESAVRAAVVGAAAGGLLALLAMSLLRPRLRRARRRR